MFLYIYKVRTPNIKNNCFQTFCLIYFYTITHVKFKFSCIIWMHAFLYLSISNGFPRLYIVICLNLILGVILVGSYNEHALPSAGLVPFLQSTVCNLQNPCEARSRIEIKQQSMNRWVTRGPP